MTPWSTRPGSDRLKKDKVIGSDLKAAKTVPQSLTSKTAEAYGDGIVKCFKYDDLKADIKKQTGASTAQVSAYVTCMDKIDDADLKQAVIDSYTKKNKQTAAVKKVECRDHRLRQVARLLTLGPGSGLRPPARA